MSDFDKEKEREKLREKYEQEEKEREATRQMSELLLQGATMTNHHCDDCGNPIFRYDGQEFCAHCQSPQQGDQAGQRGGQSAQQGGRPAQQGGQQPRDGRSGQQRRDGEQSRERRDERESEPPETGDASGQADAGESTTSPDDAAGRWDETTRTASRRASDRPNARNGSRIRAEVAGSRSPPREGDRPTGGIDEGEAALERTLTKFALLAEETDDPRRARDHLAAAREAAEALSALRR